MKRYIALWFGFTMLALYGYIGAWSVNYIVIFFGGRAVSTIGAWILGILFGETTIPLAILLWFINLF